MGWDDPSEQKPQRESSEVRVRVRVGQRGKEQENEERDVDPPDLPSLRVLEDPPSSDDEGERRPQETEDGARRADAQRRPAMAFEGDPGPREPREQVDRD